MDPIIVRFYWRRRRLSGASELCVVTCYLDRLATVAETLRQRPTFQAFVKVEQTAEPIDYAQVQNSKDGIVPPLDSI